MIDLPVACTLTEPERRLRREQLLPRVIARVEERRALDDGVALRFATDDVILVDLMEMIRVERQCCAFLRFRLTVEPGGQPVWLELTGPPGTKEFLESMLGGQEEDVT